VAYADLSLPELRAHTSDVVEPADFDAFWTTTLDETRSHDLAASFTPVDNHLTAVRSFDVRFAGFGGAPIAGWLHVPTAADRPLLCVVTYIGYSGGRGLPHETVLYALAGYAVLVMDTRGQGGITPDPGAAGPGEPGFLTSGVLDPSTYFYRRVITDAVRAVEAAQSSEFVDPERIVVAGGSQGGGLTIAVAGLVPHVVGAMPDVPFLCDFPRAIWISDEDPYGEIVRYLARHPDYVELAMRTLSYVDGAVFARRASAPALFSVGLMDPVCPPSTVYAAYNAWAAAPKQMREYAYNEHKGGAAHHEIAKLEWLAQLIAP
jgi:cephalosporin-C deacetylase